MLRSMRSVTVLACVLCTVPAACVAIGVPKVIKDKAAKAVGKKTEEAAAPSDQNIQFDDVMLELTNARLDLLLAGVHAADKTNAQRKPLLEKREKMLEEEAAFVEKYNDAIQDAQQKHDATVQCVDDELRATENERGEAIQKQAMSDPAVRQKYMDMVQRMAMAQAKGDTAAYSKMLNEMTALTAPTRADSLAAFKKCGPVPPVHPMAAKLESMRQQSGAIDAQLRSLDGQGMSQTLGASGMTAPQYGMARERVERYLQQTRSGSQPTGFSSSELGALASHRDALSAAF